MANNATNNDEGGTPGLTLKEIAATLIVQRDPQKPAQKQEAPTSGDNEDDLDNDVEEEEDNLEHGDDENDAEPDEELEQEADQPDDDAPEYFDISDDDVLTVVVDGEEREVSIGDLKKAHSLGGATEKRLQEATELRKTAHAERTQMLEKLAEQERTLKQALSSLDDRVFMAVVPPPNDQLRRTNPAQYLMHKEAYDADQKRISDAKSAVQEQINALEDQRKKRLKEYSEDAGKILLQEIPELSDKTNAPVFVQKLAATARSYGYTDAEISSALDPRMFLLVRDAMKYRELMDRSKERSDPTNLEDQKAKKIRRLRAGATSAKNRARAVDQQQKAVVAKARQTGKPQDVARTLLVPKGSRNGR